MRLCETLLDLLYISIRVICPSMKGAETFDAIRRTKDETSSGPIYIYIYFFPKNIKCAVPRYCPLLQSPKHRGPLGWLCSYLAKRGRTGDNW